jgi:AcrR family transcriptional regulator
MTERRQRRTQQERSADTVARLLEATIDLLHDRGLYRMSTSDIAERAGVSRGALTHHFSSKEEIIVAAVAHMLRQSTASLHQMAADIRHSGGSTDEIVDFLWRIMNDRLFYVTMEFLPEARHNGDFRESIIPVVKEFHAGLNAVWAELAGQAGVEVDHARNHGPHPGHDRPDTREGRPGLFPGPARLLETPGQARVPPRGGNRRDRQQHRRDRTGARGRRTEGLTTRHGGTAAQTQGTR